MSHELEGQEVVCLKRLLQIVGPDAESHAHPHVLGSLHDLHGGVLQQIRLFQSLEAEIVKLVVAVVLDVAVNPVGVGCDSCNEVGAQIGQGLIGNVGLVGEDVDDLGEMGLCVLLVIGDGDTRGESTPVWVGCAQGGRHASGELV